MYNLSDLLSGTFCLPVASIFLTGFFFFFKCVDIVLKQEAKNVHSVSNSARADMVVPSGTYLFGNA